MERVLAYDFRDKSALVTGGTGALGRAVTEAFVREGAVVYVSYIIPSEIEGLKARLGREMDRVTIIESDLMNVDSVRSLVNTVINKAGRIDFLVNVVGGYFGGPAIHETQEKEFDFMMDLNLKTAFHISRAVLPNMAQRRFGKIVHVASRTGLRGEATVGPYAIAKAGVIRLTETIAEEVKGLGVNCNCVMPSIIDTEANRQTMPDSDFTKWVKPEEIARVILFLCSEDSKIISGASLPVYGLS